MRPSSLLIANRGEIAVRIARTAAELGIASVAVYPSDDGASLHVSAADRSVRLPGSGVAAYLDGAALVEAALTAGCDAVHPGYGFLSENAGFARACASAGLTFVGPAPETLDLFGDKVRARAFASEQGVPVPAGSDGPVSLDECRAFARTLEPGSALVLKAVAGGGGRGLRVVFDLAELDAAYERCRSEASSAFGSGALYVERFVAHARHVEVQVLGDGHAVLALGERECTLQRRGQKVVEIAPSPSLERSLREALTGAAVTLARAASYRGAGTFEFLVEPAGGSGSPAFVFIEANPRLQVEHTVTEAVTGVDLVAAQLALAGGARLPELGFDPDHPPPARGYALEVRLNAETITPAGEVRPAGGTIAHLELPSGPGVRVDAGAATGYTLNPNYDSLLAKIIVFTAQPEYAVVVRKAERALAATRIAGIATNLSFLRRLLARPEVAANEIDTRFIETHAAELAGDDAVERAAAASALARENGVVAVVAPMAGRLVAIDVALGERVATGRPVAVLAAMKMEHLIVAENGGTVQAIEARAGATLREGEPILWIEPGEAGSHDGAAESELDLDAARADLAEVRARHALLQDDARPAAVARRHASGRRMVRANLAELFDAGSFIEYGALAVAAQRRRRELDDLIANTPADGVIVGIGTINADDAGPHASRAATIAYDFTVLAGTQGFLNHKKTDRMLRLAKDWRLPVVLYAEGGGGRPGDTDAVGVAGLDVKTFASFAALSGAVPLVGIVAGRCFAGNAALLGCCDVIIATADSNIGMSGPAMIEGGGLGVFAPEDIGPIEVQRRNGVVDVAVADEREATAVARRYLSYFQGRAPRWSARDQRLLRGAIPENRLRTYDVRRVIETLADEGSVLELRRDFGAGIVTVLGRIGGRPAGIFANNPLHLGGAIDGDAADKAARFIRLCDAFGLPLVSLVDTPGFMVGPDIEAKAQVRRVCRMFVAGANVTVPFFAVVLRKGYGLGAQAMTAGSFHEPVFNVAWPSAEFGAMGLEGAVKLGYRKELAAIEDPAERQAFFEAAVARAYADGKALNMAAFLEIDAVIDPAETRDRIIRALDSIPARRDHGERRPFIDTW